MHRDGDCDSSAGKGREEPAHAFILRLHIDRPGPFDTVPPEARPRLLPQPSSPRLRLTVEDLAIGETSQHASIPAGIGWLSARLDAIAAKGTALSGGSAAGLEAPSDPAASGPPAPRLKAP